MDKKRSGAVYWKASSPSITDDDSANYYAGDFWKNTISEEFFLCISNTIGNAQWRNITDALLGRSIVQLNNIITPPAISGTVNNYNPTDLEISSLIRQGSNGSGASQSISGIDSSNVSENQLIYLINLGPDNIILINNSTLSLPENRFATGANVSIGIDRSVILWYDSISLRWRVLSKGL